MTADATFKREVQELEGLATENEQMKAAAPARRADVEQGQEGEEAEEGGVVSAAAIRRPRRGVDELGARGRRRGGGAARCALHRLARPRGSRDAGSPP